jgi:hypothetical protein
MDLPTIKEQTAKYLLVRDTTKNMVELTLVRMAKTHANILLDQLSSVDELYPMLIGFSYAVTITALFNEITDKGNTTVQEIFGLQVAILGELVDSEQGKALYEYYGQS